MAGGAGFLLNKKIQIGQMKKIMLFLTATLLFSALADAEEDDWFHTSKNLVVNVDVSSGATIRPTSSDYSVKYINVNLSHYPYKDFNQEVSSIDANPQAKLENNAMLFTWNNPSGAIKFGYNAKIKTGNRIVEIREKIKFPLSGIPEELKPFTKPSEIIDSDDEDIIGYASEIAEGEDDLYAVVYKVAEWTKNNVKYDLSTLTAEVSQKASWVLDNRQGVCDELTSLFIAMLRSLGVPAKFISGVAYTNSPLFPENWGSHGWAEVYFPGYGWIPYDVTYGQFGHIDPTHIKLKESVDSNEPSVQYKWVARNIELDTGKLDIKSSVEEKTGKVQDSVILNVRVHEGNIGFGSYNLIEAALENTKNYYISTELYLSKPKEVNTIGEDSKGIFLKPNGRKSVFWIVKLEDALEGNYVYTFPITVRTSMGTKAETSFKSGERDISYSLAEISSILEQKKEEEEKAYSREIKIKCGIEREEFYYYEQSELKCRIKNEGNTFLDGLNVCFEGQCDEIDLGISQEKELNYTLNKSVAGKYESLFKAENSDVSKAEYIRYNVLDAPKIGIKNIEAPKEVEYGNHFQVEFLLSKESISVPQNAKIRLLHNKFEQEWELENLPENRKIVVNMQGKELRKGSNELKIFVEYEDGNGNGHESEELFSVNLVNVNLIQSVLLGMNQLILSLSNLFG